MLVRVTEAWVLMVFQPSEASTLAVNTSPWRAGRGSSGSREPKWWRTWVPFLYQMMSYQTGLPSGSTLGVQVTVRRSRAVGAAGERVAVKAEGRRSSTPIWRDLRGLPEAPDSSEM